jgi:hypothetical protein
MKAKTERIEDAASMTVWGVDVGHHYETLIQELLLYNQEVVHEDSDLIIFRDYSGHGINEWASDLGLSRETISDIFHDIARERISASVEFVFGNTDPIVYRKPQSHE